MTVIYAVHPGTIIRKKSSHLCFCRVDLHGNEEVIAQKPVSQLEVIYVFGQVTVTTEAQKLCMSSGVDINYFNRSYKYIGTAMAGNFKGLDLKLLQYRNYADPEQRVVTARNLVAGKISNQLSTLRYLNRNSGSLLRIAGENACAGWKDDRLSESSRCRRLCVAGILLGAWQLLHR